ncbi:hypothetical protein TNCV_415641 [Trichonephila clavipes]|nr:hypothetical protein TNCV_415641 [Trichonephila clavipes]
MASHLWFINKRLFSVSVTGSSRFLLKTPLGFFGCRKRQILSNQIQKRSVNMQIRNLLNGRSLTTATAGSDVVQSGRPSFDDFFQHLWPYIGNNTVNVAFQMVKRLWLIRIDQ